MSESTACRSRSPRGFRGGALFVAARLVALAGTMFVGTVFVGTVFVGTVFVGTAQAQPHMDRDTGYRITPPKDFEKTERSVFDWDFLTGGATETISASDHRLVSFRRPRPVRSITDWAPDYGMSCYYFPEDLEKELAGKTDTRFSGARLYRTFPDYARDRIKGFYFTLEKKTNVAGYEGMVYEMKFEKNQATPQKWLALAWKVPRGEFAVVYSCDEESYRELRGSFLASANSFRMLRDDGLNWMGLKDADRGDAGEDTGPTDIEKQGRREMTPRELERWKEDRRKEVYKEEIAKLERGWGHKEVGDYLVVSEEDRKYTSRVCKQIAAMEDWCREIFGDIEFAYEDQPPYDADGGIVRIVKQDDEGGVVIGGLSSLGGLGSVPRFQMARSRFMRDFEWSQLNEFVLDCWLNRRHRGIEWEFPGWLRYGFSEMMRNADLKGSRVVFEFDANELRQRMRWRGEGEGEPEWIPLERLFSMSYSEIVQSRDAGAEAICVVHYFLAGPGRRSSRTRHLVADYVASLSKAIAEKDREARARRMASAKDKENLSEEELLAREDAEYEKRRKSDGDREIARQVFDRAFGDWSAKDWSAVDRAAASYTMRMVR